jgi:hypothetical protein
LLAFGLTIGLFAFWALLGYATLSTLRVRMLPLRQALLAPVVGIVVNVLPVFGLNRLMPVGRFGYALAVALLVVAGALLILRASRRPPIPWRQYWPFAAVFLAALLLTGWPMLEFGFEWVSLSNPDMGNYCLGAVRFLHHAYADVPTAEELVRGGDYSLYYWFHYVPGAQRAGSELLLAWLMRVTGLSPHQVFMPLILAFHATLLSATGALVYRGRDTYAAAIAACALMGVSALSAWGVLYQLVAQVVGLALLAGCATVLMRRLSDSEDDRLAASGAEPFAKPASKPGGRVSAQGVAPLAAARTPRRWLIREGVLLGLLGAGVFVLYPEVTPFLGAAWVLYLACGVAAQWRERRSQDRRVPPGGLKAVAAVTVVAALTLLGLLWRHGVAVALFLVGQASVGSQGNEIQKVYFPFYLVPSGLANLWGFLPLSLIPAEPLASLTIGAAMLLLAGAAVLAAWAAWRGQPVAAVAGVMLAMILPLYLRDASFGLYKLAMFIQPFLLGTVAAGWAMLALRRPHSPRGTMLRAAPLVLLALPGVFVQQKYVASARGKGGGFGFGEVPGASDTRVNEEFRRVLARHPDRRAGIVTDTYNAVLAMFQSVYTRGTDTGFPSVRIGTPLARYDWVGGSPEDERRLQRLALEMLAKIEFGKFDLYEGGAAGPAFNLYWYRNIGPERLDAPDALFVGNGPRQAVFNRWHHKPDASAGADAGAGSRRPRRGFEGGDNFFARRLGAVRDHLVFVESDLGKSYFMNARDVSIYQLEPDPLFYRGTSMAGAGRHMMFQVLNPSPKVRLALEITESFNGDGENRLPPAAAVGDGRVMFPVTGRGSARVFSPPLRPQEIAGRSFVALDAGRPAQPLAYRRPGLMGWYGRGVSLDWRSLIGFARDVSLVSERQYLEMKPPSQVQEFPKDLQNPQLEYSGIFEDGWVSDQGWFALGQPWNALGIAIKGNVPDVGDKSFQTELTVLVDGQEAARQTLGINWFEIQVPLPKAASAQTPGRRRVELRFSKYQHLPQPDGRPVSCQLALVGFETAPAAPVEVRNLPADLGNTLLEPLGLDGDRWAAQNVSLRLTQPPDRTQLVVRGMVPDVGDGAARAPGTAPRTTLHLFVDSQPVGEQALGVGDFEMRADVPPSSTPGARRVELKFSAATHLPAPDARAVACQIHSIGFEPPPVPPSRVERFATDLRNPLLMASGLYGDGWAGPVASLQLAQPGDADEITIRGMVPQIGQATAEPFRAELVVVIDGKEAVRQSVSPGPLEMRVAMPAAATDLDGARKVELRFSAAQTLPPPDGRSVGARLSFIGFASPGEP